MDFTFSQKEHAMAYQNGKRRFRSPVGSVLIGLLFLIMPCSIQAKDERTDDQSVKTVRMETTIVKKRPDYIQSTDQHFIVYTATRVFMPNPEQVTELKEIAFADLPYPCRVFVDYEVPLDHRLHARRIEVIKVATGARKGWSKEVPQ